MFPGGLECFQVAWKISMYPENFPGGKFPGGLESFSGGLESFQVTWKVSTVAWNVSRWLGKFPRWHGKFPGGLESFHSGPESHTSKVSRRHLHSPESHQSSLL